MQEKIDSLRQKIILGVSNFFDTKFGIDECMQYKDMTIFQKFIDGILVIICDLTNYIFFVFERKFHKIKKPNKFFEALRYKSDKIIKWQ